MGRVAKDAPRNKPSDYLKYDGSGPWWTCDPKGEARLQEAETGMASYKHGVPLMTVPRLFAQAVENHPHGIALRTENMPPIKGDETPPPALPLDQWKTWTWKQYYNDCRKAAKAMIALGHQRHDSCSVFGFNSPQWLIAANSVILAGGKVAGIYPTDTVDQVQFKSDHSNASIAICENENCLNKFKGAAEQLPYLKAVVTWACPAGDDIVTSDGRTIKTLTFDEFLELGQSQTDEALEARIADQKPSHCCALIYTSGTTGNPKAVMISHDNVIYMSTVATSTPHVLGVKNVEERLVSYLPLSHVAGMMVDIAFPMVCTANVAGFRGWVSTNFARPYDLKRGSLVDRLNAVRPTLFLGVPRVWEKMMEKLRVVLGSAKGLKKNLMGFATKKASVYTTTRQLGGKGTTPMNIGIALKILHAVKKKLGLDQAKFCFTGAAPMTEECLNFFGALGVNINEVYGMSECTGVSTWSTDKYHVWGSTGFELPGIEVRVLTVAESGGATKECPATSNLFASTEEEQGELCYRGRNTMMGYLANDRLGRAHVEEIEQKNRDAIDSNGFLHSGDKGTRDVHGMVKITGRYKELIIGAGGENIAPVPIEDEIKRLCPFLSNIMMVGNKRKFNVCVVTLKAVGATGELPGGEILAPPASTMSTAKTIPEAMKDEVIIKAIRDAIVATNKNTKIVPSNAATIQKFTILPRDFSVLTGELTATLKLKRGVVDDLFKPIIDKMYTEREEYVPYTLAPTPGLPMGDTAVAEK